MIQHQRLIISALEKQTHMQSESYRRVFTQHCLYQGKFGNSANINLTGK